MNLHIDPLAMRELLSRTAMATGIHARFVEKDYWLSTVLREMSRSPYRDIIVFKGGTSLSKAYGYIQRFSEDVDLALIGEGLSGNQVKSRLGTISKGITKHLTEVHVEDVTRKWSRFRRTAHQFPSVAEKLTFQTQAREELVLEINAFAEPFPHQEIAMESLIASYLKTQDRPDLIEQYELEPFQLQVLAPTRTLAEKVMALARASHDQKSPLVMLQDKIRHTYDLHALLLQPELASFVASDEFFVMLRRVQTEDAKNQEFQGNWASQPLAEAWIYRDDDALWRELEPIYRGNFRTMVFGPLPDISEIRQALQHLAERLRVFDQRS